MIVSFSLVLFGGFYWVFFTDKGPCGPADYDKAWASLSDRAQARRLKHNFTVGFGDLPVYQPYISEIEELGPIFIGSSKWLNGAVFRVDDESIEKIGELPFVRETRPVAKMAHPDVKVIGGRSPEWDTTQYGLSFDQAAMMQVPWAHEHGYDGTGVLIGFLDTGFHIKPGDRHHAFDSMRVIAHWDFINGDTVVWDQAGDPWGQDFHGSICSATVGGYWPGEFIGIAPRAQFALAKTEDTGDEQPIEELWYVQGLEWLEGLGCDLTSSSLGYIDWYDYSDLDGDHAVTTVAVDSAAERGLLCVTAMGNSGPMPGTLIAPADADSCISVAAVDSDSVVTDFSSRGPTYDGRIKPELAAQGNTTYSVDPYSLSSYDYYGGTSLATPLIAGAAALLIQAKPSLTNMEIRQLLMETASNAGNPNNDIGWGVPNLRAAIEAAVGEGSEGSPLAGFRIKEYMLIIKANEPGRLSVYDVAGRTVISREITEGENRFSIFGLGPGVYFLRAPGIGGKFIIK
ncbi:MAG: S8 family peptidase [candidate division WOR-3 bacterium]